MNRTNIVLNCSFAFVAFWLGTALAPASTLAAVFLNMNFDSQSDGEPIITTTPSAPSPEVNAYATGGFPDMGAYTGTNTVYSSAGLSKAVLMSTDQAGTGSNYMDTQFLVTGSEIRLDFDIRIVAQSAGGYPQSATNTPNGQLFAINAFALDSNRVWRFAATPTDATTGEFGMRNNTDGDLIPIGSYNVGDVYHVSILANYLSDLVDVSVSGIGTLNNLPFVSPQPINGGMEEFFFFQNGIEGADNQVALDNIVGATVPEPISIAIWSGLIVVAGVVHLSRRSRHS
jgi:hypothetical protein